VINNSYLLGLYGVSADTMFAIGNAPGSATPRKTQPTAPWAIDVKVAEADAMVRAALAGRRLDQRERGPPRPSRRLADYRKLFALYQGLNTLTALANRADARGVSASEATRIQTNDSTPGCRKSAIICGRPDFEDIRMVQGVSSATAKTTAAVARDATRTVTRPVHEGALSSSVAAFEGEVKFDITIATINGDNTVSIDLADMGGEARTLDNVIAHINGKLTDAGVATRFGRENVTGEPRTVKVGTKTITLPARSDQWALVVQGTSVETVRFAAPQKSDAVYVVQASGTAGGSELLKFQSDGGDAPEPVQAGGQTGWVDGTRRADGLAAGCRDGSGQRCRGGWIAVDGRRYRIRAGPAADQGRTRRGPDEVRFERPPGGDADARRGRPGQRLCDRHRRRRAGGRGRVGHRRARAGGKVADAALTDSFVTVFDGSGEELWTQRRGAKAADEATAVSFGADGKVYVAGRSQSAMPGASGLGGWDGYLQGFTATRAHSLASWTGVALSISQFGTAGDDSVKAMTVEGSSIYTAGVESGRMVVRHYTTDGGGAPTLAGVRDLGTASGDVAGIAVSDGRVVLTGTTRNPALDIGTVNTAHSGGVRTPLSRCWRPTCWPAPATG
jgi:hypothetical protein